MAENILRQEIDKKVILSMLMNAKNESSSAFAWRMIKGSKVTVNIKFSHVSKVNNEIIFRCSLDKIDLLRSLVSDEKELNIFILSSNMLFQCEFKSLSDEGLLTLFFPQMLALPERRKHLRLERVNKISMKVKFYASCSGLKRNVQYFEKDLFDISAGGCSFIISQMEGKYFFKDMTLAGLHLSFDDLDIIVEGKVVNFIPVDPNSKNGLAYRGQKVCLNFNNITQSDMEKIALRVFKLLNLDVA